MQKLILEGGLQPGDKLPFERKLQAELATAEEANLLQISYPGSVMRMKRTTFLNNGRPIEFVQSAYSGPDFYFTLSLKAGSGFSSEVKQTSK